MGFEIFDLIFGDIPEQQSLAGSLHQGLSPLDGLRIGLPAESVQKLECRQILLLGGEQLRAEYFEQQVALSHRLAEVVDVSRFNPTLVLGVDRHHGPGVVVKRGDGPDQPGDAPPFNPGGSNGEILQEIGVHPYAGLLLDRFLINGNQVHSHG